MLWYTMGFDYLGAVSFAHGTLLGPPRVLCAIGSMLIGMTIAGLLCAALLFLVAYLPEHLSSVGMLISGVAAFATQIWGISFSMAIYEYWRGLEPTDDKQRRAEAGLMSKEEEEKLKQSLAQKTTAPPAAL